ncbi:NAD-dependent epimerase/dehydratase family protein [Clostridiaceae bacterium 35-E11]
MDKTALVTGCAGFIGAHLCEQLIDRGWKVLGIDCFTDYYDKRIKEKNLMSLRGCSNFVFEEKNLMEAPLTVYLKDIDFVFHQAGQPGVRGSWGQEFDAYVNNNILATQHLLESAKNCPIKKFIYASSSSVYGNTNILPMKESQLPKPFSPYGVSKLAAEHLCRLYHDNHEVPVIALRYFTVYGPRQRPEMAISTFIKAMLEDRPIDIYGDGKQKRDFTYIDDIIQANILAAESSVKGEVLNIGSGAPIALFQVIEVLEKIIGKKACIHYKYKEKGDVQDTYADIGRAKEILGFYPSVQIQEGLFHQVKYMKNILLNPETCLQK